MLDSLKDSVRKFLTGSNVYEKSVEDFIKDLQKALISADVQVKLVAQLTERIRSRLREERPPSAIERREWFIKVVYDELSALFGGDVRPFVNPPKLPYVIMLVGVQGSGKTTSAGKLALFYKRRGYKVFLVGADTYRPAALEQLTQIGRQIGVPVYGEPDSKDPVAVSSKGKERALRERAEVVIIDTAGRHGYGEEQQLLEEMKSISNAVSPDEVILVMDASIGQKAFDLASKFNQATKIGSILLTKLDGTAKGGGALSAIAATGAIIKFVGTGEKVEDLEIFNSRRFVSRILGMGDLEAILEKLRATGELDEVQKKMEEAMSGRTKITLRDIYKQINAIRKMGPLSKVLQMIPGLNMLPKLPTQEDLKMTEERMRRWLAIMNSMTYKELDDPSVIDKSRIRRIAKGSGTTPEDIRELLNHYEMINKMLKTMKRRKDLGKLFGQTGVE
ncbi:signal recognition particle protein [Sulfodiicoccus acidiphilus]|uniref:Signal recognition particle 54 kDa protein n=1 Tax=Sulfodiicoccus acidiphilus TaxID=1670455 RepID=A0A348B390_9CREN|nr:signal recognition particle protein Srp54 [Sulfodiicoccus acidiphilus]BBD72642.1 signal recognition particle protein [Sulfodiicoccus acidiphilus]GGT95768.1 signal recognition particle protein [Sulfodiicoccus acidiphilus]